jgi:opacity protein-like surface antigen
MHKIFFLFIICICSVSSAFAQSSNDYNKVEVFGGFSLSHFDDEEVILGRDLKGFNASITGNISRFVGLKFDFSGHYGKEINDTGIFFGIKPKTTLYNYLGGIQFKNNSKEKKVKPFAHFLIGGATVHFKTRSGETPALAINVNRNDSGFALAIGGGLDIRVSERFDIRLVQLDYNPTRFGGETQQNARLGIGILFH